MNEKVFNMIDTLHARLDDVSAAVESLSCEAPEYVGKLDKVDDRLYLLQCEIEKLAQSAEPTEESSKETVETPPEASSESAGELSGNDSADSKADSEASDTVKKTEDADESTNKQEQKKEIFTDDMKENLADAGRAIGNIYRDGKEVITELSGTMGDLKDIFSFGKKR